VTTNKAPFDALPYATATIDQLRPEALAGKRVVVWGAGSHGGGLAAARWCADAGARVAILDRRPPRELPEAMAEAGIRGWPWHLGESRHPAVRHADLIIVSPAIPPQALARLPQDAAPVACADALFFAVHTGPRIAVSGTKGKSTTTSMCGRLLDWPVGGNSHEPLIEVMKRYGTGTPIACELSSFQIWHLRPIAPSFTLGLMTSLHRDHIDWHGSEEHYRASKLSLLDWCDAVITPPELRQVSGEYADLGSEIRYQDRRFVCHDGTVIAERDHLSLPGEHNAVNAALALTAAVHMGLDPAIAGIRLSQISPLPHRLEAVHTCGKLHFIDDSIATTPEAAIAGLRSVDQPIAIILGGADKGADYASLASMVASLGAKPVCLGRTAPLIASALEARGLTPVSCSNLSDAIHAAVDQLKGAGTVLLSPGCASTDQFADFADRGDQFCALAQEHWGGRTDDLSATVERYLDRV
jgi:UDP-N-acetylmuramoylalanine--D-glutamate ligase